jgi:hypothetical protein
MLGGDMTTKITSLESDLKIYFWVVFGYSSGLIPLRSFPEKGNPYSSPITNVWVPADDDVLPKAVAFAEAANSREAAFYVIPGTVSKTGRASSVDVMEMQVLLIDIDEGNTESKLLEMTEVIGEPTMVVESGGITKEGYPKLHVYWQLLEAVSGEDLRVLVDLRHKIALAFGGDTHFKSAHQPIRVAGSVYHKGGNAKPVKIRSYTRIEYDLQELVKGLSYLPTLNNKDSSNGLKVTNNDSAAAPSLDEVMTNKIHEGGNGECSRFANLQRIIGYWLRRYHDGLVTQEEALEEIIAYNEANVVPPWPIERLKPMVAALWKKHVHENGEVKKADKTDNRPPTIRSFSLKTYLKDESKLPEDIIAPRVLTPGGIFVFGGAPKVGKSDFLLSLFVHMAAGKEFLGFAPPRPLRVFYFQAEIEYHYLRERLQSMQLPEILIELAEENLYITPNTKLMLNEQAVKDLTEHILEVFPDKPDIIAVDPIRNVFDGGRNGATENENDAMMFFLQKRIEALRDAVNPNAGIVLAHHTKKISATTLDEDPFQAFSGASSLRGYYSTGALLYKPEMESNDLHLIFELRNGPNIPTKILSKKNGIWVQENTSDKRIAFKKQGALFDRERERRIQVILELLKSEALKGKFYLMKQFAQKFQNHKELGGKRAIYDDCSVAATVGWIKFFDNPKAYGLPLVIDGNASFGFMCAEGMKMCSGQFVNAETGEITEVYKIILPTHYKRDGDGKKEKMINPEIWQVELEELKVENAQQ